MTATEIPPSARSQWRTVVLPSEHGGWGLTAEPALLGLLVAPSWAGLAIGVAGILAFVARTPLKLVLVDARRHRWLPRTRLAALVATAELAALAALVVVALALAGPRWLLPFALALPCFAVELWFDARSRGRHLAPEVAGAVGITAIVAAIAMADGSSTRLAIALWMVLAARAFASVPFARGQVRRLRRGAQPVLVTDLAQLGGAVLAIGAWVVDADVLFGSIAVLAVVVAQLVWSRRPPRPAKVVGLRQLALGLLVVAATAIGVVISR